MPRSDVRSAAHPNVSESALAWVIVDGVPRHVSDFAALAVRRRPAAYCHTCGARLTLKLGDVRRHHAAHRAGAACPTTHPETALHSDCKLALAAALRAAASPSASLSFRVTCDGANGEPCRRTSIVQWSGGWDDVRIERRIDAASRPDIVLLREGAPVGALEILVWHAVEAEASDALARAGIPWVEIEADPNRRDSARWDLTQPLDARRVNDTHRWRCDVHASMFAMREAKRVVRESTPDECDRARTLRSARVVDLYHPNGGHERFIYRVVEERDAAGDLRMLRLLRGNLEIATVPADDHARSASAEIAASFRADIGRLRRDDAVFADSPMRWAHDAAAEFITTEAVFDRRRPDPTVLATTYPRRWFYSRVSGEWFLPDDMLAVRWDRGRDDPFAPHPAAFREVTARASAAPEGSWSTFVFARRPSLAAFRGVGIASEIVPGIVRLEVKVEPRGRAVASSSSRVLCVVTRETNENTMADVVETLPAGALWLTHPRDWRTVLTGLAWAAAGSDSRGRGAVVIDGIGVVRADAFLRGVARGDWRFSSENILRAMTSRVERLASRAKLSISDE
jgi:hypothetical protein